MTKFLIHEMMMGRGLKLKGCELLLFALIWSFTAKGKVMYVAEENLAEMMMYTREHIGRSLRTLRKKELIVRNGKHPGGQSYDYVVNIEKVRQIIPAWCDDISKLGVMSNSISARDNVPARSDNMSQNNKFDNESNDLGDKHPLPFLDAELNERWVSLLKSPKWQERSEESLREAILKLQQHSLPVAILMIRHTIEGDYPMIYDPTPEMIERAKQLSAKSEPKQTKPVTDIDGKLFGAIIRFVPKAMRHEAFGSGQGERALRFRSAGETVQVSCPLALQKWLESSTREVETIIQEVIPNAQIAYDYY